MKDTKKTKTKKDYKGVKGILELFVCASIGFMAYIVLLGVDDTISKVLTIPALMWVAVILVQRFTK